MSNRGSKIDTNRFVIVDEGTKNLTLLSGADTGSVDIYSYRPATLVHVKITLENASPIFAYGPDYKVFSTSTGNVLWGFRTLIDTTGPFGTDANGNQVYALLRVFVERSDLNFPMAADANFNVNYWFTNSEIED